MSRYAVLALALLAMGCPKKQDEKAASDAAPAASASAATAAADTAAAAASASATAAAPAGALPNAPPNVQGVSTDPNAPPSHEDHDKAATAQVHKGNYKSEMDKLEKEDLSADRK